MTGVQTCALPILIPIKEQDICVSLKNLERLGKEISSFNLTNDNPSLNLAKWLTSIPVIYYPWGLQAAAIRFKNSLQENAKMHAMTEDIIESCHNGIVAWEGKSDIKPILIKGNDDYIKTKERWSIVMGYFEEKKIEYREIFSAKGSILTKLVNLIYLFDYTTIYRAVILGIDPTPVTSIDFIKKYSK